MEKRKLQLQSFLNRDNKLRDVYHDLMPYKVDEILLISNLYDAYVVEEEGRFSEIMLYDYGKFNLTTLPRITGVSTQKGALDELKKKEINMIVIMVGFNKRRPLIISKNIKKNYPDIPILMLLGTNHDTEYYLSKQEKYKYDKLFIWNGESRIFFAMIKWLEDSVNTANDTQLASVRVILIVEDSPAYYSSYITHLYKKIFRQTNDIVQEVSSNDLYKVLKLRTRPKVLLASNYEEAVELYDKYKDYLFCTVTDIEFKKNGKHDESAGVKLTKYINESSPQMPVLMMSSKPLGDKYSKLYKKYFIDKNMPDFLENLIFRITQKIGFGKFIFRNSDYTILGEARTIKEFGNKIKELPIDSLNFHASRDHFSKWLMARAEIQLANQLVIKKTSDFDNPESIRKYVLKAIKNYRDEKSLGKIIPFSESAFQEDGVIVKLADGGFGGKGRGLSFLNAINFNIGLHERIPGMKICLPKTSVIGFSEFEEFYDNNKLSKFLEKIVDYNQLQENFLERDLTPELIDRLRILLKYYKKPLAVRSSGLFEDSVSQPFAGIFESYMIPNNNADVEVRLKQLMEAVKLVYASVFSEMARNYTKSLNQKLGEEKMAVVIQELVGEEHDGLYFPLISGVAQSYNYYPFGNMDPMNGSSSLAIGLGKYVVEGEISHRFSPPYPKLNFLSLEHQVKFTQTHLYAVDMTLDSIDWSQGALATIKKVDIYDIKNANNLKFCVSEYDYNNRAIYPGLIGRGPIVPNFAPLLNNGYMPLAKTIETILNELRHAFDTPIEIEFVVDVNRDEEGDGLFYLLQVKPMLSPMDNNRIKLDKIDKDKLVLFAEKSMGNGIIKDIFDVIYIKNDVFDKLKTEDCVTEIDMMNSKMRDANKNYVLIGPGRWGTQDKFLGIPVKWPQISHAKVIVETEMEGFFIDASYGSHFFHNLTSLDIAYFSVFSEDNKSIVNYEKLLEAELIEETTYFRHVRFNSDLNIRIDGKLRQGMISIV